MYYKKHYHRWLAMLLVVCMTLTLYGGFAFAVDEGADNTPAMTVSEPSAEPETPPDASANEAETETLSETPPDKSETETPPDVSADEAEPQTPPDESIPDGEQGESSDPAGSDQVPSSEDGADKLACTCPPVDSGEVVHGEDCPQYAAPEKPAAPGTPTEALAAVYALIDALPTLAELEAVDTEGADFPAYLEKLQADVAAARAAYDALTDEEKAAFDPARLQKLTDIEGLFGVSTMALAVGDIFTANVQLNGVDIPCRFKVLADGTVQVGEDALSATSAIARASTGALVIPSSVSDGTNSYTVTAIGQSAFTLCTKLTDVTIPNSVTAIGKTTGEYATGAFYQCTSLKSINIPNGVTTLGYYAFSECPLTTVSIPNSVTEMGPGVFAYCRQLESVNIPTGVNTINSTTFFYCVSLESIHIPSNVTTIDIVAFAYCKALTSVTIPDSVTSIGYEAFQDCSSLTSITISSSVTTIGYGAFKRTSLTSITIPCSVTTIDYEAFYGCASLTSAVFQPAVAPTMGTAMFNNVPDGLKILIPHTNSGYLTENTTNGWATYAPKIVTVTGVTVAPDAQMVIPGGTQQFTATVAGNNNPLQTVAWAISGQSSASTTISTDGLLTVAADETATPLTVTATSSTTEAPAKSGTATVSVRNPVTITTATPTHATTYGGADGSIAITASGGKGTYQYSTDNTNWQDEATLTGLAAGDYTVYARDKDGTANVSAGTAVTIKQPAAKPIVSLDNANTVTNMIYGDLLKLGVTATAPDGGTLTYQWYEVVSGSSVAIKDANSNIYAPTNIARIAAGEHKYYCYVINTQDGTTGTAYNNQPRITVTVAKYTPTVTLAADPTTTTHGGTVKLTATVNAAPGGSTPTGTVTFKDGEAVLATVAVTRAASGHGEAVYNYAIPISHGEITATYTAADPGNYNSAAPVSVTVTVNKKPLTITVAPPANLTYDGTPKTATLTGADGLAESTDYTLTYSTANPTDVGSYTATFALTTAGETKYTASGTLTVSFAITPAAGIGTVSCADIMFGGTVAPVPVSTTNGITNVTYLYKVKNADDSTYSATVPAVVGDYTVKATFAATTNYTEATATADFKITPAAVTGITVTPYSGVYDGAEHPIVTVTGTQTGDKVYYTIPSGSPTEAVPMVTKVADNMTVLVKVTRANHTDYAPTGWFSAKVEKKEVAATFTVPTDLVYDGSDKTVTAAITNKCGADDVGLTLGDATGTAVGNYTTTVTGLSGAAAGNYKLPGTAPSVAWEITGTPYPHEIALPTASGITYGQKLSDSTLTGNNGSTGSFTWNDGAILPPSGNYTATVVFTPNDQNFAPVTRTVQVAVAKKDVTVTVSGTKAYHTTPIANADFVVSNLTGMVNGETDAALLGTLTLTSDGNKKTAIVGSYDISVAQSGESNYSVTTTIVTDGFTVTRAAQTLSGAASYQKLLTEADFPLDVKTDSTDTDAAVTYTLTNDGGGAVTLDADGKTVRIKKPGTATITANAAETANFAAAAPLSITVTIGSNPTVRALATEDITTTGAKIGGVVTTGTIATTGYGLEYKKPSDADYTPVSANETATGDVKTLTHTLAGLEKDTEYAVRVWAKTADKTFESVTRFRTAAEQPPTGKVEGAITDNSGTNTAITVTIEAGNTVIASHTVKAGGGTFTFEALPDGFYNLVADNGKYRVTRMVEIVKGGAVTNVTMEIGRTQSVVEIVTPDTPNVAVDGLPKLFENDALFTQDNKEVIAAGGTVEFKLTVEKKDAPDDAEEIDKIAEGKVGVYLDIGLRKTVIDQNGREQESELVPDLGANEITIVIPLPKELQGKQSYTVYRVHNGTAEKLDSTHNADGNTLTIQSSLFSTYAIAYTEKSSGGGGGSGGSSSDNDQYDFWMTVKDKIQKADSGDVIKVNAKGYDKMPWSVMDALYKNDGVSLVIIWNGKTITIPAGKAQKNEPGRIYWPLSLLAELYEGLTQDSVLVPQNPETGGPGKYIPVTGGDLYEMTAPMADQVTQPAAPGNAGAIAPMTPAVITPPDAGFEPDTFAGTPDAEAVKTNSSILWVVIAGMLTATAVACGVWFWKRKEREQA